MDETLEQLLRLRIDELEERLERAIEPGSEEALKLAKRLSTVGVSGAGCARQLSYVEECLRGEKK